MNLFDLMEKILGAENGEVTIEVPEENFNLSMLQILRDKGRRENKTIHFTATGPRSKRLIGSLEDGADLPKVERDEKAATKSPRPAGRIRKIVTVFAVAIGILIVLGAAAFGALYYIPKAEVVLTLSPIPLVKEIPVVVDAGAEEVAAATGTVPGTSQAVEENGTKSAPATGTAIVGEKAKGTLTFINCTGTPVTFAAGAQIKAEGTSTTYTLDAAIADVPAISGSNCGTKTGSVTATKIGTASNKEEGTEFDFSSGLNEPSYNVIADSGQSLSGGTSQEVTIASADDQSKLLTDLQKELVTKAKETIRSQSGIDEVVVEAAIKTEVVEKKYSHAVGEQAENVTLTLKIKLTTVTYKGTDIQDLISQTLSSLVPSGFTLFPGETAIEPLNPVLSGKKLTFRAKVSAEVIPDIDAEKIKNDLAGRNAGSARDYLNSLSDVNAYELVLWPNLPESLQRIPKNTERITITLVTED
jgi:hypothetical protein